MTVSLALAQQTNSSTVAAQPSQQQEILNNDGVIQLKQLGLGEGVIVDKIKTSPCQFDLSLNGLKQLKAADISDTIISAMLSAKSGATAPSDTIPTQTTIQSTDPNDPKSPHDSGIYLYGETDGKPTMTKIEPTVYTQAKGGVALFHQLGQSVNIKAVLHPAHAMLQCANSKPVFYFYFENTQSGLGETRNIATSPNEFLLAQFEIKDSANLRSLIVGQANDYTGTQNGPKDQSVRPFDAEKLSPGIYKVSPKDELANGEFCFFYGGDTASGAYGGSHKVFDFGVKNPPYVEPQKTQPKHQGK